jgi:hypothetical protein
MKERIWFDLTLRSHENGKKEIQFFRSCPQYLSEHIKHHLEQHFKGKSAGITLEEVKMEEAAIPVNDTDVWDLKLSRHNMFSIEADQSKQTTPVACLVNTVQDMKESDVAKISICAEPYNLLKWNSLMESAP